MQKITLLSIALLLTAVGIGQSVGLEYKGGETAFAKLLIKHLYAPEALDKKDTSTTFSVLMTIDQNGIIRQVDITSFGDSVDVQWIIGLVNLSQSNWINHSGRDQFVGFEIYCIPGEEDRQITPPVNTSHYFNGVSYPVVHFHPIICRYYKPVR